MTTVFVRIAFITLAVLLSATAANGQSTITCPSIDVTGPAGVIQPGDSMTFSVSIGGNDITKVDYVWIISAGTIISGQGTPSITVETDRSISGEVTAQVTLKGVPPACKNSASQTGQVACVGDPPLIDEYGVLNRREEIARLDEVIAEYTSRPGWAIYVITYEVSERSKKIRANLIKNYLASKKVLPAQLVLVSGGRPLTGRSQTKIYLVPPKGLSPCS